MGRISYRAQLTLQIAGSALSKPVRPTSTPLLIILRYHREVKHSPFETLQPLCDRRSRNRTLPRLGDPDFTPLIQTPYIGG